MKKIFKTVIKIIVATIIILPAAYYLFIIKSGQPSNDRNWQDDQAILPYAEFSGDKIKVFNIRNFHYRSETDYDKSYYDSEFDLSDLTSVDFVMVPFPTNPDAAHTFLSFGFLDGRYLAISPEARKEKGEKYSAAKGLLHNYELIYIVADEKDVIGLRANHRHNQVYIYPGKTTKEKMEKLLIAMLERANKLKDEPEFYNTFFNSCSVNLAKQINQIDPGRIKFDSRIIFSGKADELAIKLGLVDTSLPLEEARKKFNVSELAKKYQDSTDFSKMIRMEK
jgi:hypothetical protein